MFTNFTRATNKDGLYFYSKDILLNNYIFQNDIEMKINFNYYNNSIGVVFIDKTTPEENLFLCKISDYTIEIIHKTYDKQQVIYKNSHTYKAPIEQFIFYIQKKGNKIIIYDSQKNIIIEYNTPVDLEKYSFGIYSNKGNTLNDISIKSGIANRWITNINNSNGGRIEFINNGFIVEGCNKNAEIEQSNIYMPTGRYYLKFDSHTQNNKFDIKPYIYMSNDARVHVKDKNILQYDNDNMYFDIKSNDYINIRFEGTNGKIKNIALVDNISDSFVPTYDKINNKKGGYINIIKQSNVNKIIIKAITNLNLKNKNNTNILLKKDNKKVYMHEINRLKDNKEYSYEIDFKTNLLSIYDSETNIIEIEKLINDKASDIIKSDSFVMFYNLNTVITSFIVITNDGKQEDLLIQKTKKYYVPGQVKSPIIVCNNDIPLDLSSSYRAITKDDKKIYTFTNWEREVFYNNIFKLEKQPSLLNGSIYIYAIPYNAKINIDKLYNTSECLNDISMYSDLFDIIPFNYEYYFPYANVIRLPEELQYSHYVVDYLKDDSYCINYDFKEKQYEIDISCQKKDVDIFYDYEDITVYSNKDISNKYIVLSPEGRDEF